jgi:hypothetical protein
VEKALHENQQELQTAGKLDQDPLHTHMSTEGGINLVKLNDGAAAEQGNQENSSQALVAELAKVRVQLDQARAELSALQVRGQGIRDWY